MDKSSGGINRRSDCRSSQSPPLPELPVANNMAIVDPKK
jgi:hypothetical protein